MAAYDSPGFADATPAGVVNAQGYGAPGSPGVSASETAGPVVGSPAVVGPYQSSQLPIQHMDVRAGDTASVADDVGAHQSVIAPGPQAAYLSTGSGQGSAGHVSHPNAGA